MSQVGTDAADTRQASQELDRMIRQGRSFSGLERNCCFLNTMGTAAASGRFADISAVSGLDLPDDGRGLVYTDWDQDGDVDLWISNRNAPRLRFFRNNSSPTNGFLQIRLTGNGVDTNRSAIGARVTVVLKDPDTGGSRLIKTLRAGEGFLSQSSSWLHFGLGQDAEVERVQVRWPNQDVDEEEFGPLNRNARYELVQGSGEARAVPAKERVMALTPAAIQLPPAETTQRIPLVYSLPAPTLSFFDFSGRSREIPLDGKQATLVNLWSTTCQPCLHELSDFERRSAELEQAGVRILALSIDGLDPSARSASSDALKLVQQLKLQFECGMVSPELVSELRGLHNMLIKLEQPLPLPTSFLIDRQGQLDIIYKGPVDVDTLLQDATPQTFSGPERFQRASAAAGTYLEHEVVNSAMARNEADLHFKLAREAAMGGKTDVAVSHYLKVLQREPDSVTAHNDLALLFVLQGRPLAASQHFEKAIALDPEDPDIRINLARALVSQNKTDEARQQMQLAIEKNPEHAEAHFQMGNLLTQLNDLAGAQDSYQKAVQSDERHARAHFTLGNLLERNAEFEKAKLHYQLALEVVPNEALVLASLGRILTREQDFEEAEKLFRRAIDNQPAFADGHFQLGLVLVQLQRHAEARRHFEEALRVDPAHAGARSALQQLR